MDLEYAERHDIGLKYLRNQLSPKERADFEGLLMDSPDLVERLRVEAVFVDAPDAAYGASSEGDSGASIAVLSAPQKGSGHRDTVNPPSSDVDRVSPAWRPIGIAASLLAATLAFMLLGAPENKTGTGVAPRALSPIVVSKSRSTDQRFDVSLSLRDEPSVSLLIPIRRPLAATFNVRLRRQSGGLVIYQLEDAPYSQAGGIFLELPTEPLDVGIYELTVTPEGAGTATPLSYLLRVE